MKKDNGDDFGFGGIDEDGNEFEFSGKFTDKNIELEIRVLHALLSGQKVSRQTFDCSEEELTNVMNMIQDGGVDLCHEEGSVH